jgi:DNA polymerase-1
VNRRVLLLDGNSLTYRAFFALPADMATASGQVTNAVFGFTSMLINLLRDHPSDAVAVAWDRPEPTFRHEADPAYKAQREQAPDILRQQLGLVRQVLDALGIAQLELSGFEADDVIATLADRAAARGDDVLVVTGDRDSYQLVTDPHVRVLYNRRGVSDYALYDEAGIVERTGVRPSQYVWYAALRGDPSDNLPGVPGVGEKTAAKLVSTYGDLDGIYAHLDAQTPKLRAALGAHEDRARRNAELMVLRRDAPLPDGADAAPWGPQDPTELKQLFDFLEFRSLYDRLREVIATPLVAEPAGQTLEAELVVLDGAAAVAAALEGLAVLDVAGAWDGAAGRSPLRAVTVVVDPAAAEVLVVPAAALADGAVRRALTARTLRAHDAKPLLRSLLDAGIDAGGALTLDTAIAAYLLDPAEASYGIGEVLSRYTGDRLLEDGPPPGQLDFGAGGGDDHELRRAARAALAVGRLAPAVLDALEARGQRSLYDDVENPLVPVLARMEHVGVGVDVAELRRLRDELTAECRRLQHEVWAVAGREFNVNSTPQLRQILFDEKGLAPSKKTKTGFSTDAQSLEKLRDRWPEFIDPLLSYRELEKLRSTYGEGLLAEVGPDGRIHATFNQTVARTGRLSSDQPNLHNIPVRSDEGRRFRRAFVPAAGFELLVADYNQIELRCIAHLAHDPGLIEAFAAGRDIHTATASRVFSVAPAEVTHEQRAKAKMVSYGLAYGMEAYGLGQRLNIPTSEAAGILDAYFAAFPAVRSYMERTVEETRQRGYTETLFGRRRPIPELSSPNLRIRQAGERQAMNAGIQGLAADIFKVALVRLDAALRAASLRSRIVLQVHDEVVVEVADGEHDEAERLTVTTMQGAATLSVPLAVNLAFGPTWADAKA